MPVRQTPVRFPFIAAVACIAGILSGGPASGQGPNDVDLERDGIIYIIGQVQQKINQAALVDIGEAHTIRRAEKVAVIRRKNDYFVPVGVVEVDETQPTFSLLKPQPNTEVRIGDIVMVVREFSELVPPDRHQAQFIQQQIVKNSGANGYSTRLRSVTAATLYKYSQRQPRWEKRTNQVLGYLNGESFSDGREKSVSRLVRHINMLRRDYREGRNSLSIMGPQWNLIAGVVFGKTAVAQHAATQVGDADLQDGFADEGPTPGEIVRTVDNKFFDRNKQEKILFQYMISAALERSPRQLDLWVRQRAAQSQFLGLEKDDVVLNITQEIIRDFKNP